MAAIYMWNDDVATIILTTTLYPVEVVDAIVFGVTINAGFMGLLPASDMANNYGFISGSYIQKKWFYSDGPYDSDMANDYGFVSGNYEQKKWFYTDGPYDSDMANNYGFIDGSYVNKLVIADTPDEKLQLSLSINTTCSMDLI